MRFTKTPKAQRCASHSDYGTRQALQNYIRYTNGYRNRLSVQRRFWYSRVGANPICRNIKTEKDVSGEDSRIYCKKGFYQNGSGGRAAKAQALFIRKYGRDTFLHAHDKLNEAYDFKKAQELLETDVEIGLKIRYEEVQNSELDDLWNGMCWGADPVHLHDHDPAVQKSGLVDPRLPQGHSGEVF